MKGECVMLYYDYNQKYTDYISKEDRAINEYLKLEQRYIVKNNFSLNTLIMGALFRR